MDKKQHNTSNTPDKTSLLLFL